MARASGRPPARVACLLLPAWPLQVAARARPELLGMAAAVACDGVILAASAAALAAGVRPGLTEAETRARCPDLTLVPDDLAAGAALTAALAPLLAAVTPIVERARPGVFFLDWGGVARRLREEVQFVSQIGIADGPFAAAVAAHHIATPDAPARVPPGGSAAFLAPFDIAVLPGVRRLAPHLRALGLPTVGQVARLPEGALAARLGDAIRQPHRLARGHDARPLRPEPAPAERAVELAFDPPEESLERLLFAATRALRPLWDGLEREGLAAGGVRLTLALEGGDRVTVEAPLLAAAGAGRVATDALRTRLAGQALPASVVSLTVTLTGVGPAGGRQGALAAADRAARRPRQLEAVARLWALCGAPGALRLALRPALVPDQAVVERPWDDLPAPDPLPLAQLSIILPGVPGMRRVAPPRAVGVVLDDGRPEQLIDGGARRRLVAADGPYRAVAGWWEDGAAGTVDRDYYLVAAAAGEVLVLVNDRAGSRWAIVAELD